MSIETPADWRGLREAGRVTRLTLDALEREIRAGVSTAELDEIAAALLAAHGARSAPATVYGFHRTVMISINDEIVHGIPGSKRLEPGDLVKIDVTIEKDGYIADAARSVVVDAGSETAHRLAACAEAAFQSALQVARAGTRVNQIGRTISQTVRAQGFTVVRGLTGHGVGRTIHEWPEVPNHYDRWQRDVLTENLVITIEPMISAGSAVPVQDEDGWTIKTSDGSLAAHFEHTLVITKDVPIVLT